MKKHFLASGIIIIISAFLALTSLLYRGSWGIQAVISALYFSASLAAPVFIPTLVRTGDHRDLTLWSLGPSLAISGPGGLISSVAILFILTEQEHLATVLNIILSGYFAVCLLLLHAARTTANAALNQTIPRSSHAKWAIRLDELSTRCSDEGLVTQLNKLAENFRYLTRDTQEQDCSINHSIEERLVYLVQTVADRDTANAERHISELTTLIAQRENKLRSNMSSI